MVKIRAINLIKQATAFFITSLVVLAPELDHLYADSVHLLEYSKETYKAHFSLSNDQDNQATSKRYIQQTKFKYLIPIPASETLSVFLDSESIWESFGETKSNLDQNCEASSGSITAIYSPEVFNKEWFFGLGRTSRKIWSTDTAMASYIVGKNFQMQRGGTLRILYRGRNFSHGYFHGGDLAYYQIPQRGLGYSLGISQAMLHWHSHSNKHYWYGGYYATSTNILSSEADKKWIQGFGFHFETGYSRQIWTKFYLGASAGISYTSQSLYNSQDKLVAEDERQGTGTLRVFISAHPGHQEPSSQ